jgi:hypothetical protein
VIEITPFRWAGYMETWEQFFKGLDATTVDVESQKSYEITEV